MYRILIIPSAQKEYKKLPKEASSRIADVLDGEFRNNPFARTLDIKRLHEPLKGYRLRVGDYRISYTIAVEANTITIYRIKHRKDAYR